MYLLAAKKISQNVYIISTPLLNSKLAIKGDNKKVATLVTKETCYAKIIKSIRKSS